MADATTPRLNLVKPEVGGSADTWGDKWNENADKIDAAIIRLDEENVWSAPQHFDGGLYDGGELVYSPNNIDKLLSDLDSVDLKRMVLRGIPFPFPGETPPPGAIAYDGAELLRDDFPELWAWAQQYATIVTDAEWHADMWGAFSSGDGLTTFRVPDLRGEHIRGWDAGRGIDAGRVLGSWQPDAVLKHTHYVDRFTAGRPDGGTQFLGHHSGASPTGGRTNNVYPGSASVADENRVRTLAYHYCAFY